MTTTVNERAKTTRVGGPRRRAIETFPVTIVLALQYGTLVIVPAVIHRTSPEATILGICVVGIAAAFATEAIRLPLGSRGHSGILISWRGAFWIMAVGWFASGLGAFLGQGTYAAQIGTASASHLSAIVTPFLYWPLFGVAMALWLRKCGEISNRRAWIVIGVNLGLELSLTYYKALLAPLMSFGLAVAFLAVVTRMIRLRFVIVAVVLVPLLWPVLYNLRNERRLNEGANSYSVTSLTAANRLRLDLEMAQVAEIQGIPANIGQPSFETLIRTGLVPRFLDSGRGTFNTASGLSVDLGGPADNSATVTALGLAYVEKGWAGIVVFVSLLAIAIGMAIRREGPWALAVLATLVQQGLWIEAVYPDLLASILQAMVSLLVAVIFGYLFQKYIKRKVDINFAASP